VDQVFGIVRGHHVETDLVLLFEQEHALVDPVEAVGLGGGAVVRTDRQMNVGKASFQLADSVQCWLIVGVGADEEMIVVVIDGGDVVLHHARNDLIFVPQRHEDRDVFLNWALGRFRQRCAAHPCPQADGIEHQVVQSADQNSQGGGKKTRGDPDIGHGQPG
jgi:hypothetical protein